MRIFATDPVVAKSRFWYFLRQLRKFKKTTGEIVSVEEIKEKNPLKIKVGKDLNIQLHGDHLNMTVFLWYLGKVTCPVYVNVHVYTGHVTFSIYQKNTAMFNLTPCTKI